MIHSHELWFISVSSFNSMWIISVQVVESTLLFAAIHSHELWFISISSCIKDFVIWYDTYLWIIIYFSLKLQKALCYLLWYIFMNYGLFQSLVVESTLLFVVIHIHELWFISISQILVYFNLKVQKALSYLLWYMFINYNLFQSLIAESTLLFDVIHRFMNYNMLWLHFKYIHEL